MKEITAGTGLLFGGLGLFALLIGFLSGANNTTVISGALVAGLGAIAGMVSLAEKIHIDKTAQLRVEATGSQTKDITDTRSQQVRGLANALGLVLITITMGFASGFGVGLWASDSTIARFAEPWKEGTPPQKFDEALGWLALGEKLQKAGFTQRQIERVYRHYEGRPDAQTAMSKYAATISTPVAPIPPATTPGKN